MPAVALTDHGSLAGSVELYKEAGKHGVKPVIGCEVYVADDRKAQQKGYAHLTLLAESNEGYANLIKLASAGYLEGYYYKPRVDWELLQSHSKGLIALSGCLSGRVCKALENGNPAQAEKEISQLRDIFGAESTYLEIQDAGLEVQKQINVDLAKLAETTGLPLVATGDVHYLRHEDARAHERSSASSQATRSPTRTAGASTPTSSTSRRRRRWRRTSPTIRRRLPARSRSRSGAASPWSSAGSSYPSTRCRATATPST